MKEILKNVMAGLPVMIGLLSGAAAIIAATVLGVKYPLFGVGIGLAFIILMTYLVGGSVRRKW